MTGSEAAPVQAFTAGSLVRRFQGSNAGYGRGAARPPA